MRKFLEVIKTPLTTLAKEVVDCGTCPVSLSCAVGEGGNGWRFKCCGMSGYVWEDGLTLAIDCQNNKFEQRTEALTFDVCPLCSGGIIEVAERGTRDAAGDKSRYLATVYAKVPLAERIVLWKTKHSEALVRIKEETERRAL